MATMFDIPNTRPAGSRTSPSTTFIEMRGKTALITHHHYASILPAFGLGQ
jgi:hypothetical protein